MRKIDFRTFGKRHGKGLAVVLVVVLALLKTAGLSGRITDAASGGDALANIAGAYNLAYHGIISGAESTAENLSPSDYREPLPIFFLAAHIRLHPALSSGHTVQTINEGSAAGTLKKHNLFWAFLVLAGVGLTCLVSMGSIVAGILSAIVATQGTQVIFLQDAGIIDRMVTEVQAAALLALLAFVLIRALKSGRLAWFVASGGLLGALALTKGIFLYVGLAFIVLLFLIHLAFWKKWRKLRTLACFGAMFISMSMVVLPWMIRNWVRLGAFEVTQRGGVVMMVRAKKELMTDLEYKGAVWYYAPNLLKRGKWGLFEDLHFTGEDLEEGGRLRRLNRYGDPDSAARDLAAEKAGRPEDALSFYRAGRAERVRLQNHYRDLGAANPSHMADVDMQKEALSIFMADPLRHLKMSALFLWRGMWCMESDRLTIREMFWVNGLSFLAMWGMAIAGLIRRSPVMLGVAVLPVGAMALMALTTHYIPRYSSMLIPAMITSLALVAAWGMEFVSMRVRALLTPCLDNELGKDAKKDRLDSEQH